MKRGKILFLLIALLVVSIGVLASTFQVSFISPTLANNSYTKYPIAFYINASSDNHYQIVPQIGGSLRTWMRCENGTYLDYNFGYDEINFSSYFVNANNSGYWGNSCFLNGTASYINLNLRRELISHNSINSVILNITTYDGGNQSVHPDIYYNSTGWNGWKYWMVYTPYPNSNSSFENPSIAVSNDSVNWTTPDGLVNPISPLDSRTYFQSDPDILMENGTMYIFYRAQLINGNGELRILNSSDGISWSNYSIVSVQNTSSLISPMIVYHNNLYHMWYGDLAIFGATNTSGYIRYLNTSDKYSWDIKKAKIVNIDFYDKMAWHGNVNYIQEYNQYWMVFTESSSGARMFFANSSDGVDWQLGEMPLLRGNTSVWDGGSLYRPSFLFNI